MNSISKIYVLVLSIINSALSKLISSITTTHNNNRIIVNNNKQCFERTSFTYIQCRGGGGSSSVDSGDDYNSYKDDDAVDDDVEKVMDIESIGVLPRNKDCVNDEEYSISSSVTEEEEQQQQQEELPSQPPPRYKVKIQSIRGKRNYMEDEFICILPEYQNTISSNTGNNNNLLFASIFDGHGGSKVSQYLRQNLFPYFQSAIMASSSSSTLNHFNFTQSLDKYTNNSTDNINNGTDKDTNNNNYYLLQRRMKRNKLRMLHNSMNNIQPPTINDCINAISQSLQKIDDEIQVIRHWSFQGSTACCILLHHNYTSSITTIISVNIGDSRAVLSHDQIAIDLSIDHKPDHPKERARIEKTGGNVTYMGDIKHPKTKKAIPKSGIYRINGNLALSRAIGDRAENPWIISTPDIKLYKIQPLVDSFIIIASDGLWDVMTSQEVVDFIHDCMIRYDLKSLSSSSKHSVDNMRDKVIKELTQEALRRGSMDNITIIIMWLQYDDFDHD